MPLPSILGGVTPMAAASPRSRSMLRTGRVVAPCDPSDAKYQDYVKRCLSTWAVDVELENGEYVPNCRVLSLQGNSREGLRRLPRLPSPGANKEIVPGDLVVVGFLNGFAEAPVVLGTLSSVTHPNIPADTQESAQVTTKDINEAQDRREYIDWSNDQRPLVSSVMTRNSGLRHETEQRSQQWVGGKPMTAQRLERSLGGRSIEKEQTVEVEQGVTAIVRESNREGVDLREAHVVKTAEGVSSVTVEDLKAQVLQLTQQVAELSKLVVRSDKGEALFLQQETPKLRTTVLSDSNSRTVSLLAEDRQENTRASLVLGAGGTVTIRRNTGQKAETTIALDDDDSLMLQIPSGPTVFLRDRDVIVTSGKASVTVSEEAGVSLVTAQGASVNAVDDTVVVTGQACTINAPQVHLSAGTVLLGPGTGVRHSLVSGERLLIQMRRVETALSTLALWCRTHTHPVAGATAGPSLTRLLAAATPTGLIVPATDFLRSTKGV